MCGVRDMGENNCEIRAADRREFGDRAARLDRAYRILGDTTALFEIEIERLMNLEVSLDEKGRYDLLQNLIKQAHAAIGKIDDIETKVHGRSLWGAAQMNLEDARAEIMRRFDRLAADGGAPGVSGRAVGERDPGDALGLGDVAS